MNVNTKKENYFINVICFVLIVLWIYAAMSKLIDLDSFKLQLYNQAFGKNLANLLIWLLPLGEITTAMLLCFNRSRLVGLILSFIALLIFTSYISLVLLNFFPRIPCSCGGVLKSLGWHLHLWFNIFFLAISSLGIFLIKQNKSTSYL